MPGQRAESRRQANPEAKTLKGRTTAKRWRRASHFVQAFRASGQMGSAEGRKEGRKRGRRGERAKPEVRGAFPFRTALPATRGRSRTHLNALNHTRACARRHIHTDAQARGRGGGGVRQHTRAFPERLLLASERPYPQKPQAPTVSNFKEGPLQTPSQLSPSPLQTLASPYFSPPAGGFRLP